MTASIERFLFHNNGDGTFSEVALDAGAALSSSGKTLSGMGVVFQDYDNDGLPDLLVTQLPHEPYVVFHNDGKGSFSARELETGFGRLSGNSSGWGVGLEDFDNDGWKDETNHVVDFKRALPPPCTDEILTETHHRMHDRS